MNLGRFQVPGSSSQEAEGKGSGKLSRQGRSQKKKKKSQCTVWASYGLSPDLREVEEIESPRWIVKERPEASSITAALSTPRHRHKRARSSDSGSQGTREERERRRKRRRREGRETTERQAPKERYKVQSIYGDDSDGEETQQEANPNASPSGTPLPMRLYDDTPPGQEGKEYDDSDGEAEAGRRKAALLWISPVKATVAAFEDGNALLDISNQCPTAGGAERARKPKRNRNARPAIASSANGEEEECLGILSSSGSPDILGLDDCSPLLVASPMEEESPLDPHSGKKRQMTTSGPLTPLRARKRAPSASPNSSETASRFLAPPKLLTARHSEEERAEPSRSKFVIPRPRVTATGPGGLREFSLSSGAP